jgi:large subunit ribosomal protein L21
MYAIIRAGGKQYKVQAGDTVRVEKMEKNLGDTFDLPEVLMVGGDKNFVGEPLVQNAKVTAVVTRQAKAPKVIVFKKKRRQGYRRMQGHRQLFTELFIKSITNPEGQKIETDKKALIIDPVKIQARKDIAAEKHRETRHQRAHKVDTVETKTVATKKKAAPKAGAKSAKSAGRSGAKKTAKKSGAKKASGTKTAKKK